jgi:hypothetical protein
VNNKDSLSKRNYTQIFHKESSETPEGFLERIEQVRYSYGGRGDRVYKIIPIHDDELLVGIIFEFV